MSKNKNNQEPEYTQIGRLAMRQESGYWNAYYAHKHHMKDAVLIGSIRMAAVMSNKERKKAFMDMMRDIVSDIIESETGVRPKWGSEMAAPEIERTGNC